MERYINQLKQEGRFSTAKSYQDALRSFTRFRGTRQLLFSDISRDMLRAYEAYLLHRNCRKNTVSTYMRRIRCIYNQAVDRGEARAIPRLFHDVFTGIESRSKRSLALPEQHSLLKASVPSGRLLRTQQAANLMFQLGGMAFVDLVHLRTENLRGDILEYRRRKTGTPMRLRLSRETLHLLDALSAHTASQSRYLLPFLSGKNSGYAEYKEYRRLLTRFNQCLHALRSAAGVDSQVTSYTIRHSFAMSLKEAGTPIEMISDLMGHASVRTTQIYLRSFSLEKQAEARRRCFERVYNFMSGMI